MVGTAAIAMEEPIREEVEDVVIRFAGDSGDGIQITGWSVHPNHRAGRKRPGNLPGLSG